MTEHLMKPFFAEFGAARRLVSQPPLEFVRTFVSVCSSAFIHTKPTPPQAWELPGCSWALVQVHGVLPWAVMPATPHATQSDNSYDNDNNDILFSFIVSCHFQRIPEACSSLNLMSALMCGESYKNNQE